MIQEKTILLPLPMLYAYEYAKHAQRACAIVISKIVIINENAYKFNSFSLGPTAILCMLFGYFISELATPNGYSTGAQNAHQHIILMVLD